MATSWNRVSNASQFWAPGTFQLDAIPSGNTLLRVRFSWGFTITTAARTDMSNTQFNSLIFGLVTTVGNGTETVPDPRINPGDAAPPTQRWIWWEMRWPVVTAVSEQAGVVTYRDSGPQERVDARAQVLATGIPGGDTLNVWASWAPAYGLDVPGDPAIWVAASVLSKS